MADKIFVHIFFWIYPLVTTTKLNKIYFIGYIPVLAMFCSNHVQNMDMEHVLVHVLFLFSLFLFQNIKTLILEHDLSFLEHMFQKNHGPEQGLEHVHVPVLFLFPVNP